MGFTDILRFGFKESEDKDKVSLIEKAIYYFDVTNGEDCLKPLEKAYKQLKSYNSY